MSGGPPSSANRAKSSAPSSAGIQSPPLTLPDLPASVSVTDTTSRWVPAASGEQPHEIGQPHLANALGSSSRRKWPPDSPYGNLPAAFPAVIQLKGCIPHLPRERFEPGVGPNPEPPSWATPPWAQSCEHDVAAILTS